VGPRAGLAPAIEFKHLNAWVLAQDSVCATKCEAVLGWVRETVRCSREFGILVDLNTKFVVFRDVTLCNVR